MCMVDDCEFNAVTRVEKRKAIKVHRCTECGRSIDRGETYEFTAALYDGHWSTYKTCAHCHAARRWLVVVCGGWVYNAVIEELIDHWGENWVYRSLAFGKLIVHARRRWRDVSPEDVAALVAGSLAQIRNADDEAVQRYADRVGWKMMSGKRYRLLNPETGDAVQGSNYESLRQKVDLYERYKGDHAYRWRYLTV